MLVNTSLEPVSWIEVQPIKEKIEIPTVGKNDDEYKLFMLFHTVM